MTAFEDPSRGAEQAFRAHRSSEYLHPVIEKAVLKARDMFERDAINPENFVPPYDRQEVANDVAKAKGLEQKYSSDDPVHKKYADVFEAVVYECIEQQNWFGDAARTIKTSKFDDYENGVDLIVELENVDKSLAHLGLGIDVTFGTVSMQKKFGRIKKEIEEGRLGTVKYFESEQSPIRGEYRNMPRVVIGTDRDRVVELAARWMDPKMKKDLAHHPIQTMILDEIIVQLKYFRSYAEKIGQHHLVSIYGRTLALVGDIRQKKQGQEKQRREGWGNDKVFGAINDQLELFKK